MSRWLALDGGDRCGRGRCRRATRSDPCVFVEVERDGFGERDDGLFVAEVVGLRRGLHLFECRLLLRIGGERVFVGLVGCGP